MMRLVCLRSDEALPDVQPAAVGGGVQMIDARELRRHAPDRHLLALDIASAPEGVLRARCSCWWSEVPAMAGERVGTIGHYAASDGEAGSWLIEQACRRLRDAGCTVAIAPMDGNTWRRYRFIIERGEEPTFFLEPDQPDAWPDHFIASGFAELATYTSAVTTDLAQEDPRLQSAAARLAGRAVTIRAFDPDPARAEADLRRIYTLSRLSFAGNYLYTPIDEAEFIDQYRSVLPMVRPELVLLAERGAGLVGFLFALPDLLQLRRTGATDTIIIKTVAVAPGAASAGLGSVLVGQVQRQAHALGYRRAIHALMHERNVSQNISRRYARTIRRYALFSRAL
jgi:GNAT superfamily N-acetyltransferase